MLKRYKDRHIQNTLYTPTGKAMSTPRKRKVPHVDPVQIPPEEANEYMLKRYKDRHIQNTLYTPTGKAMSTPRKRKVPHVDPVQRPPIY